MLVCVREAGGALATLTTKPYERGLSMFKLISEDSSNPCTRAIGVGFTALISGLLLLAVVCAPVALAKGKPDPGGPGLQLIINEVFLTDPFDLDDDANNQLMDIFGADFDPGDDPLVVTLGMWDLTDACALIGPDFDHISCALPAGGVGVAGDYLLKVSHGLGQSEGDEYDLTIAEPPVPEGTIAFYAATATARSLRLTLFAFRRVAFVIIIIIRARI